MIRTNGFRMAAVLCGSAALAAAPPAARGDGTFTWSAKVYGFLNAEVERVEAPGGATPYQARGRLSDGNSRVGLSGSVDLFPATKAIWQLEASLNGFEQAGVNDRGLLASITSRNTFVGVADERFGTLVFGNVDSAYRSLVGSGGELGGNVGLTVFGLDLWNNTSAQMTGNPDSVFSRGEARYKNSVHYLSPDWIVRGAASYAFDEAGAPGVRRDRAAFAARLKLGGFQLGAGLDWQGDTGVDALALEQGLGLRGAPQDGVATWYYKAVASYAFPSKTYVGLGLERSNYGYAQQVPPSPSNPLAGVVKGTMRQTGGMISVAQSIGKLALMGSFGKLWGLDGAIQGSPGDYAAWQLSAGALYAFADQFAAYAYYTRIDNGPGQSANLGQAPIYSNGLGTDGAYLAPGDGPRGFGVGLIARF
ncbi:MAG TPA: porin [Anaeromyxobacteraceae bacterium]|nr:porin [Anaeromyxobacteraceae bacterium]